MASKMGKRGELKELLLIEGMKEIERNGITGFSLRNVAKSCGVSCAAPYKHFHGKDDFLNEVILYIINEWHLIQDEIIKDTEKSDRELITQMCMSYVRFLSDNPHYRAILMLRDVNMPKEYLELRARMSSVSHALIERYCESVNMSPEAKKRKVYMIRTLIYGSATMMNDDENYPEDALSYLRFTIEREFDIP